MTELRRGELLLAHQFFDLHQSVGDRRNAACVEANEEYPMQASDIMTTSVVTVPPDMTVQEVAWLMAKKHVSGLPVVSPEGHVLGMISEADLLRRVELGTDEAPARWPAIFAKSNEIARGFTKAHGTKAHDVMARPVISVQHDVALQSVADTLARHAIKRVPVMKDDKLAGIIARSDLVRAFGQMKSQDAGKVHIGNGLIHKAISDAMHGKPWLDTSYLNVTVNDGVVRLTGYIQSSDHSDAVRVLVEEIPGVERVEQDLKVGVPLLTWDGHQIRDQILT
jgi:CBS domain-containing protein